MSKADQMNGDEEQGFLQEDGDEQDESFYDKSYRAAACYEDGDEAELAPMDMDEDTFGMSVCSLTRDTYHLQKDGCSCARVTRLITSLFLVFVTITMQVQLLYYVKAYVSARAVHSIRSSYSLYEDKVYGCESCTIFDDKVTTKCLNSTATGHCIQTINGKWRGLAAFFPGNIEAARILGTLDPDEQDAICHIPLTHPLFFGLVLVIWVLTAFQELRKCVNLSWVVLMLPTTDSMANAIESNDDGEVIVSMTYIMKAVLVVLTFLPRVVITVYLGWVGMRWLMATTAFSDLILNAVALEFILFIKEVIYGAVMPTRNVHDLGQTKIAPHPSRMSAAWFNFSSSVSLFFVAILVVYLYMHFFQRVLPQYNWDVREVCLDYIHEQYAV